MSTFAHLAEARIQEALDAADSPELSGRGQPIDLDAYFAAPSAFRAGFGFLKSASVVPPEVSALQEIASLRSLLEKAQGSQAAALRQQLQMREVELAMAMERMRRALRADATM